MQSKRLHGCALCGGDVFSLRKSYILKIGRFKLWLEDLGVGVCERCGEEYHPSVTSVQIDDEIQLLLDKGVVSTEDVEKMDLIDTASIIDPKLETVSDWLPTINARLNALEQKVRTLKTVS